MNNVHMYIHNDNSGPCVKGIDPSPLPAQCSQIYKRLKGITAQHAMQSVITRFREQPGHDGIFFHVKVRACVPCMH